MITSELFNRILLDPAKAGADTLYVVSGYATSAMVEYHLRALLQEETLINLKVIVGMTAKGVQESNHTGFVHLMDNIHPGRFECSYLHGDILVHSKMYAWFHHNAPKAGYVGSANYTQQAFLRKQKEAMEKTPPLEIREYFSDLQKRSCFCNHPDADGLVRRMSVTDSGGVRIEADVPESQEQAVISFLANNGQLPEQSGLNWGQRPHEKREPNQAYIRIPVDIRDSGFFPERGIFFTIHTDDGQAIIAARRQDEGKALHSVENNSIFGEYFRRRIGVGSGKFIAKSDLEKYGRTDVTFYKIDDENYYMDFSVRGE